MDLRTEQLIALVKDGATLKDAGSVYGISGERVRQILKEAGLGPRELPGRAGKPPSTRSADPRELAQVIQAMWREGMLSHEIAEVFDISSAAVHRLICERVVPAGRPAQTAGRLQDGSSSDERLVRAMREAACVLAEATGMNADERRNAQAVIDGWLAAHREPKSAASAAEHAGPRASVPVSGPLSPGDLRAQLERFKEELRAGGLRESTIHSYLCGSRLFVRWLAGEYVPGPPRADRVVAEHGAVTRP